jgi:hypothetical protein
VIARPAAVLVGSQEAKRPRYFPGALTTRWCAGLDFVSGVSGVVAFMGAVAYDLFFMNAHQVR